MLFFKMFIKMLYLFPCLHKGFPGMPFEERPFYIPLHFFVKGQRHRKTHQIIAKLLLDINTRRDIGQADHGFGLFRIGFPVRIDPDCLTAGGIGNDDVLIVPSAVIGQDDKRRELVGIDEKYNGFRFFVRKIHVLNGLEYDIGRRDFHHGKTIDKLAHVIRRLDIPFTMEKVIICLWRHEGFDLFGQGHPAFPRCVPDGQKMAKPLFSAGKVLVLITEPQPDAGTKAPESPDVAGTRFPLGGSSYEPHDTAPLSFLELNGLIRFCVRPDECHGMIF